MPTILGAGDPTSGYEIQNSLRLDSASSAFLSRNQVAPTQAGQIYTISVWNKICFPDGMNATLLYGGYPSGSGNTIDDTVFMHNVSSDGLFWQLAVNDSTVLGKNASTKKMRDVSAWFHAVLSVDTTQGTDSNRWKLFVNGTDITSTMTGGLPVQNQVHYLNQQYGGDGSSQNEHRIGRQGNTSNYSDMYIADFAFVDGTALDPTYFGETNDEGIWVPKKPTVASYGNNGWLLEFKQTGTSQNSSGIGADTSGNDNHFAVTNVTATDVTTDTPTNNFCTIDSSYADDGNNLVQADFSEGNTKMVSTVDGWKFGRGTFLLEAGKWYVEVKATEQGSGENGRFGLQPAQGGEALGNTDDNDTFEGINVGFAGSDTDLQKLDTGSGSTLFSNFSSGSIAMLAFDLDNDKVWVGSNGTWSNGSATQSTTLDTNNHDFTLPTVDLGWVFGLGMTKNGSNNIAFEYNWGQPSFSISSGNSDADGHGNFEYAVPSGFFACCTKNLAEYG